MRRPVFLHPTRAPVPVRQRKEVERVLITEEHISTGKEAA